MRQFIPIVITCLFVFIYFELIDFLNSNYPVDEILLYLYIFSYPYSLGIYLLAVAVFFSRSTNHPTQSIKNAILASFMLTIIHIFSLHKTGDPYMYNPVVYMLHVAYMSTIFIGVFFIEWLRVYRRSNPPR